VKALKACGAGKRHRVENRVITAINADESVTALVNTPLGKIISQIQNNQSTTPDDASIGSYNSFSADITSYPVDYVRSGTKQMNNTVIAELAAKTTGTPLGKITAQIQSDTMDPSLDYEVNSSFTSYNGFNNNR